MELRSPFQDIYDAYLPSDGFYAREPSLRPLSLPFLPWEAHKPDSGWSNRIGVRSVTPKVEPTPTGWILRRHEHRLEEGLLVIAGRAQRVWFRMNLTATYGTPDRWRLPSTPKQVGWDDQTKQKWIMEHNRLIRGSSEPQISWIEEGARTEEDYQSPKAWQPYWERMQEVLQRDWTELHQELDTPLFAILPPSTLWESSLVETDPKLGPVNVWAFSNPRLLDFQIHLDPHDVAERLASFIQMHLPKHRTNLFSGKNPVQGQHDFRLHF